MDNSALSAAAEQPNEIKLYGIGRAMIDLFAVLPETVPLPKPLKGGQAVHIKAAQMDDLIESIKKAASSFYRTIGGTTVNILRTAAALSSMPDIAGQNLKVDSFFSGSTGTVGSKTGEGSIRDKDALFFQKECARLKIRSRLLSQKGSTGRFLSVYKKAGSGKPVQKSAAASPSAASLLNVFQIDEAGLAAANCVVMEGFLFQNAETSSLVLRLCKTYNKLLALDAASVFAAPLAAQKLAEAVKNGSFAGSNLLFFVNEQEAIAIRQAEFGQFKSLGCPIDFLIKEGALFIEKRSKNGVLLRHRSGIIEQGVLELPLVDDTGAGDAFAAAFILCHLTGNSIADCLKAGNKAAALTLNFFGCTLEA